MCRRPLLLLLLGLLPGCPAPAEGPDMRAPAGLFGSCTPGLQDPPCGDGLRCSLVLSGDAPYQGMLTQCVPVVSSPLAEDAACGFDQDGPAGPGGQRRRFDRCAAGQGCVQTARGLRCRPLCVLQVPGQCAAGQICVLRTQVESVGYCAAPDRCQPVPPQMGCPASDGGQALPCYVLTEASTGIDGGPQAGGGTFCVPRVPLGDSSGAQDSRCDRSANCQAGLSCVNLDDGTDPRCRPYCAAPPDGGTHDGGTGCAAELGTCHAFAYYGQFGQCY